MKETQENLARESRAEALGLWKEPGLCQGREGKGKDAGRAPLPRLTPNPCSQLGSPQKGCSVPERHPIHELWLVGRPGLTPHLPKLFWDGEREETLFLPPFAP